MYAQAFCDLALAHDWEYDWDFIRLIETAAQERGLSTYVVSPANVVETLEKVRAGALGFGLLFDRASGASPDFTDLHDLAHGSGVEVLEPLDKLRWASDKATMHLEFISRGLYTPHSLILPPYNSEKELDLGTEDLVPLGSPFVIKPANTTGGSVGVVANATGIEDVFDARRVFPSDKYLLQEKITPEEREGRRFWFRGFYILGDARCAWWDDRTHLYEELSDAEREVHSLGPLVGIVKDIAGISGLRFFSTEIVRDVLGRFLAVDYVNEICDMRLQSRHPDGVPDSVVRWIAGRIASYAAERKAPPGGPPQDGGMTGSDGTAAADSPRRNA